MASDEFDLPFSIKTESISKYDGSSDISIWHHTLDVSKKLPVTSFLTNKSRFTRFKLYYTILLYYYAETKEII